MKCTLCIATIEDLKYRAQISIFRLFQYLLSLTLMGVSSLHDQARQTTKFRGVAKI